MISKGLSCFSLILDFKELKMFRWPSLETGTASLFFNQRTLSQFAGAVSVMARTGVCDEKKAALARKSLELNRTSCTRKPASRIIRSLHEIRPPDSRNVCSHARVADVRRLTSPAVMLDFTNSAIVCSLTMAYKADT
jgi:hypothetical protein